MEETKKIPNEDLEAVSGGTASETAEDSRFLNVLLQGRPHQCDRYGSYRTWCGTHDQEIMNAWASVGIKAELNSGNIVSGGSDNEYFLNGKQITQEQARQHAMDVVGKHLTREQWDW